MKLLGPTSATSASSLAILFIAFSFLVRVCEEAYREELGETHRCQGRNTWPGERGRGRKGLYEFGFGAVLAIGCKLEYELERGNTGDEGLVAESVAEETDNSEGDLVRNAVSVVEGGTR